MWAGPQDPGSAPVLGERVKYVITLNGTQQVSAKAEPLALVQSKGLQVDRAFYLNALRKAVNGLFVPIIEQKLGSPSPKKKRIHEAHAEQTFKARVMKEANQMLWTEMLYGRLTQDQGKRSQVVQQSAIARAFLGNHEEGALVSFSFFGGGGG